MSPPECLACTQHSIKAENRHWFMNDSWCGRELLLLWAALGAGHWNCDRPIIEWCRGRAKKKSQWWRGAHAVQPRHEELQGVAEEGASECTGDGWKCMSALRRKTGWGVNAEQGESGGQSGRWSTKKKEESASVDLHLLKTKPDAQVSLHITGNSIIRIMCACLISTDHNPHYEFNLHAVGCSWSRCVARTTRVTCE